MNAQCIRCHNAGGKGKQAGPELAGIGKQTPEYLLEAIVAPSAKIAKGFETVMVVRDDGKVVTGTLLAETDQQIVVGDTDGNSVTIPKTEIDDRSEASQSAMPNMATVLTPREVRDLVAYLLTLK